MVRPVVHSTKHYHQITLSTVLTVARNNEILASAVALQDANTSNEVVEGAIIKAVYFEMWLIGGSADEFFTCIISKNPSGHGPPSFTEMTQLFTWDNKKNILFTAQGLASNDGVGNPIPVYRGWIKIPKSKQRFGLGDSLAFTIASRGADKITYCGFATYKEYT